MSSEESPTSMKQIQQARTANGESNLSSKNARCCGTTVAKFNVIWMGICFLGLFSCFNPIQALQSGSQRHDYGFIGIGVLYGTFSLATLFSSAVVRAIGQRIGLLVGATCYLIYIATLLVLVMIPGISDTLYQILYYLASMIIGFGAAVLWTSQGSLLTVMSSKDTLGLFNGIFWGLFMGNYVIGGLITQFVLNSVSQVVLYIVFSSLAFASVAGLLLVRPTRDIARGPIEQIRLSETVRALFERRTRYLWGAVAYSGLSSAFNNVIYTSYIGERWVGWALVCFGVAEVVGSVVGGKLSDRVGRSPVFLASCFCNAVGTIVAALSLPSQTPAGPVWMYFVAYFFLGLGDSGFNTQVQAVFGFFHSNNSAAAFAAYRCVVSVFNTAGAISGKWITQMPLPWPVLLPCVILWTNLLIAMVFWTVLDLCVARVNEDMQDEKR